MSAHTLSGDTHDAFRAGHVRPIRTTALALDVVIPVHNEETDLGPAVTRLQDLGVKLSLDDFGTGYSSLSHLTMPLQELKIDRQFVTHMTTSPRSHAIARAVVDVAHDLGLRVVGEGVEDPATLEALRRIGCDEVQGYQLCPPIPEVELQAWLRDQVVAERVVR